MIYAETTLRVWECASIPCARGRAPAFGAGRGVEEAAAAVAVPIAHPEEEQHLVAALEAGLPTSQQRRQAQHRSDPAHHRSTSRLRLRAGFLPELAQVASPPSFDALRGTRYGSATALAGFPQPPRSDHVHKGTPCGVPPDNTDPAPAGLQPRSEAACGKQSPDPHHVPQSVESTNSQGNAGQGGPNVP